MKELSLHILDITKNSVSAGAKDIRLTLTEAEDHTLSIVIADDGRGMTPEFLARVTDPFTTTRTTRKVGLGIPLMAQNARLTGGDVRLESTVGKGTQMTATLDSGSIDCLPLGDLAGTMTTLISANPDKPDFVLVCKSEKGEMLFDTRQVRQVLSGVPLNEPEITAWMLEAIQEEIEPIFGGVIL